MNSIKVLHIGIKYWPFIDNLTKSTELKGIRGGGMNKYCDLLINSFPNNIYSIIICQKIAGQEKHERKKNILVYRIKTFGSRATRQIFTNIYSFFIGIRIIKKENIDLIHGHMQPGIFIAYWLGKIFNKPVVGTPYSFATVEMNFFLNKLAKYIETKFYPQIDVLVFESDENRNNALLLRNLSFSNSVVIHTGIEMPKIFKNKTKKGKINIFYIGRLVKIKALDNLVLSIKYLSEQDLNKIHLNIIGEGEMSEKLKGLINANNLNHIVTLHGFVKDVTSHIIAGDIFILPSYREGLSVALLEAMSFGKACIVNNFGVPFKKNTIYEMKNNDPKTIAQAISSVINSKELYQNLSENARKEICDNFSVKKFSENYYQIYNKLKVS